MREELLRLQLTLATAFDALSSLGLIDRARFAAEVDSRMAAHRAQAAEAARYTTCSICKQRVLVSSTLMSADGPVCPRCAVDET